LYFIFFNLPHYNRNLFANLIIFYYFFLLTDTDDFIRIKHLFFGVITVFTCVSLIPEIYQQYSRKTIFDEVSKSTFLMMSLFVVNVVLSTSFGYNPYEIYGIKSGILYGRMSTDIYNIFPFAIIIVLRKGIKENNVHYLILYFLSIFFILLTMRRSVMALSFIGSLLVLIELVKFEEIKKFILYGMIIGVVSSIVISQTSFVDQFIERFEQRGLDNRPIEEESRLLEFGIVYKDLFVYYDYDPWFGYGLFDSWGNYGKKIFGDRSLHTDPTNLIHSSGLIGLGLYLGMFGVAFTSVWKRTKNRGDLIQFIFISLCFLVFFINGRYTTTSAMILMLVVFFLPFGKKEPIKSDLPDLVKVGKV
jgi:O-antigen ligase